MIDIVTNNVRQIGTPADEGRVYISEKAYKRIKTEGFKDKEVFVLMGHTESSGGRYATFVEAAIAACRGRIIRTNILSIRPCKCPEAMRGYSNLTCVSR